MNGSSEKYKLDKKDFWSILLVGLLVGIAAFLTYVLENIHYFNFGTSSVFIVPVITVIITSLIRWLKDFTKDTKEGEKQ
jgi:tellurite resistance protein TehA-like permease